MVCIIISCVFTVVKCRVLINIIAATWFQFRSTILINANNEYTRSAGRRLQILITRAAVGVNAQN